MSAPDLPTSSSIPEEKANDTETQQHEENMGEDTTVPEVSAEPVKGSQEGALPQQKEDSSAGQAAETVITKNTPQQYGHGPAVLTASTTTVETSNVQAEALARQVDELSVSQKRPGPLRIDSSMDARPPPPPEKDQPYLDPTPKTPLVPQSPISPGKLSDYAEKELPDVPKDSGIDDKQEAEPGAGKGDDSQSEIQSIMDQFGDESGVRTEEVMSPRLELAEQFLGAPRQFPPRGSSLEHPKGSDHAQQPRRPPSIQTFHAPVVPPKPSPHKGPMPDAPPMTPLSATSIGPPPPAEPDQPFDFHRFLDQLRHRTADPVAKFLRSFLNEFGKKQWMVHEQVKIISDFLAFITNKMAQCEVWRHVSDAEFDNAKEGMEKLVMNRLYSQTFSPAIPPPPTPTRNSSKGKRKDIEKLLGPGRRGQHQEDVERDEILAQKIRIYSWIREEHLDIPPVGPHGRRFLNLAQQELLKIKGYRAPRDKVICILNCCKVIFGLLRNSKSADTSADSFMPMLIYVVLQANPEHLVSNVQYILRFRNQEKLGGEAGYYLSSLSGAIQFIETLDRTSLTVSDEEFERNVEAAVSAIAEQNRQAEAQARLSIDSGPLEKSISSGAETTPRTSLEAGPSSRRRDGAQSSDEESAPVAGLLRTIQKPLSTIGRIFTEETGLSQPTSPRPGTSPRLSPAVYQPPRSSIEGERPRTSAPRQPPVSFDAQEAAARQASAEVAEARRIQRAEHNDVVETLSGMFPNLDKDVIDDVVRMKEGRVGLAVDACLALSAE
ncbi:guanine nucleotide exchange factor Vps9, putative [Paecilomyces variotii No. 5]|uniref:Guanine nucleotide exchange factor Vps9, putative n=1 Tax=Byssochlamys spectabilis (strain No. 5 / NBRC 109023) TaxID=1356009 RepID=V5HZZ6_BYSSN|nr:guanine nucleotide exchange factor Vps9, putative [Paecilomyces variotii No. 5]